MNLVPTMFATVLRGLRARALLSAGSVLLTALAIGSAVLGPVYQEAVTNSYLVTRLNEAPNNLTGLSWRFTPDPALGERADVGVRRAEAAADRQDGPFAAAHAQLETPRFEAFGGLAMLLGRDGACAHLEIEGACPTGPDEILMLTGDLEQNHHQVGDVVHLGPLPGPVRIVGSYRVPESEGDHWFDLMRFASVPRHSDERTGVTTPYQPAPLVVAPAAFDRLGSGFWTVRVDRRLDVPADWSLADLRVAQAAAARLDDPARAVDGGRLQGESINDLPSIAAEARAQQATARSSIAPAVISLILVALALLLRLLMAAADLRLPELALASLRGLSRRQMWALGLSEPLALLGLSVPVGALIGIGLSLALVRWWLVPGLPLPLPGAAALAGLGVAVASVGVAVLAVGLVLRVSLSEQLTGVRRPRESSRAGLVVQLALVAGAVAVLASKLSGGRPGEPDVTDLILPVLLAVVAGIAATRLTAAAATWWTAHRRTTRSLAGFVAARAISRRQEGTLVILPVTAAIAVCVFGVGVFDSAAAWRASVAATAAPAPVVWTSPKPLDSTVALTHELDPDGKWLMAASTVNTLGPTFVVADTPRLSRVASWQDQWTPGISADQVAGRLGLRAKVPVVTGTRVGLSVNRDAEVDGDLVVRLRLVPLGASPHYVFLGPFDPGTSTHTAAAPYCRHGCRLEAITIGGPAALPVRIKGQLRLSGLIADGSQVPGAVDGAGWVRSPEASAAAAVTGVESSDGVLTVSADSGDAAVILQLVAGDLPAALPVVRGVDAHLSARTGGGFSATSANEFTVDGVVSSQSVPFLGPNGLLIDYQMLTTDRDIYEQNAVVHVLARATPRPRSRGACRTAAPR